MRYFKKIVGEQVYLSPLNTEDGEVFVKWLNDKAVAGYLGNFTNMINLHGENKILEDLAARPGNFAIVRLEDDELLGSISLMDIDHLSRRATLGIMIGEAADRGKGYGTEAIRLLLDYGFRMMNLHNIDLTVHADNGAGIACYKKVGFQEMGRRRESKFKDGKYVDVLYMDILDTEFYGEGR